MSSERTSSEERTDLAAARTVLAVERTFNAWLKTAIAFLAGGLGLAGLMRHVSGWHEILVTGAASILVAMAILITVFATLRLRLRMASLRQRELQQWPMWVIASVSVGFIAVCLIGLLCLQLL